MEVYFLVLRPQFYEVLRMVPSDIQFIAQLSKVLTKEMRILLLLKLFLVQSPVVLHPLRAIQQI